MPLMDTLCLMAETLVGEQLAGEGSALVLAWVSRMRGDSAIVARRAGGEARGEAGGADDNSRCA